MTQKQRVKEYLLSNHSGLTSLEASRLNPPIMRLSERVREIQADGLSVEHIREQHENGYHTRYVYNGDQQLRLAV